MGVGLDWVDRRAVASTITAHCARRHFTRSGGESFLSRLAADPAPFLDQHRLDIDGFIWVGDLLASLLDLRQRGLGLGREPIRGSLCLPPRLHKILSRCLDPGSLLWQVRAHGGVCSIL